MVSILKKRFNEISLRKAMKIKSRWFEPLTNEEISKLGWDTKKDSHVGL